MVFVKRCVPPMPGMVPKLISGKPNLASVDANIKSHYVSVSYCSAKFDPQLVHTSSANSNPPPNCPHQSPPLELSWHTHGKAPHRCDDGRSEVLESIVQILQPPTQESFSCGDVG